MDALGYEVLVSAAVGGGFRLLNYRDVGGRRWRDGRLYWQSVVGQDSRDARNYVSNGEVVEMRLRLSEARAWRIESSSRPSLIRGVPEGRLVLLQTSYIANDGRLPDASEDGPRCRQTGGQMLVVEAGVEAPMAAICKI